LAALLIALLAAAGSAGASESAKWAGGARAFALQVVPPSQDPITIGERAQDPVTIGEIDAPPDGNSANATLSYPAAGSVVSGGQTTDTATLKSTDTAAAAATSDLARLSLFGGEITADAVAARANAAAGPGG